MRKEKLKFRAFNNVNNKMIYDISCCDGYPHRFVRATSSKEVRVYDEESDTIDKYYPDWDGYFPVPNAIIMQWTGLKDKNEKYIYEGDIIKGEWEKGDSYKGSIEYKRGEFLALDYKTGLIIDHYEFENSEVIGNIFENPELIEK